MEKLVQTTDVQAIGSNKMWSGKPCLTVFTLKFVYLSRW
jgi:hypothetical protein